MKPGWPYLNLFRSKSTKKYALEIIVPLYKGQSLGKENQYFDGDVYHVDVPKEGAAENTKVDDAKMHFRRVELTPSNDLDLGRIVVKIASATKDPEDEGTGSTGTSNTQQEEP